MSADLVRELERLGAEAEWPPTPDLAPRVVGRLAGAPPRPRRAPRRGLAIAVALALLVPAGGAVAFPAARDDVLEWLGLKSVEVRRAPEPPAGARPATRTDLGTLVTLEQAERRAGFAPILPPRLGDPQEVRLRGDVVTLVYAGGIRLAQLPGALDEMLLRKIVGPRQEVRAVAEGIYIEGEHVYLYLDPAREVREARTTGNTLITQRGDVLLRLEGVRDYAQASELLAP